MATKPVIFWITDGVSWGFDIRAKALSRLLPEYEHVLPKPEAMTYRQIVDRIEESNPDVLMAMSPIVLPHLGNYADKTIVTLPSFRSVDSNV